MWLYDLPCFPVSNMFSIKTVASQTDALKWALTSSNLRDGSTTSKAIPIQYTFIQLLAFKSHCHDRRQVSDLAKHRSTFLRFYVSGAFTCNYQNSLENNFHISSPSNKIQKTKHVECYVWLIDEPLRYGIMVLMHNLLEASYRFPARHWPISKSQGTCTSHTELAAGYHCLHIVTQHPVQRRWWKGITVSQIICDELMSMELRTTHWTLWFSQAFASFGHAWPWIQIGLSLTWKASTYDCEYQIIWKSLDLTCGTSINHLMDTEYAFSPWDLCKAHILVSTPEKTAKNRLRHKTWRSTKGAAPTKSVINLAVTVAW